MSFIKNIFKDHRRRGIGYWASRLVIVIFALATLVPFYMLLLMSFKSNLETVYDFWSLPKGIYIDNYIQAFFKVIRPMFISLFVVASTIFGVCLTSSLAGYSFGRYNFKFKEGLYLMMLSVVMIPFILMIVPLFIVVYKLNLTNNYLGLILPYIAVNQLFAIGLLRSFFSVMPLELFEAARVEGAGEISIYWRIALPMSKSVLLTISVITFLSAYNDYLWPTLVLTGEDNKTFTQSVVTISSGYGFDFGLTTAAYVIGIIPMLFMASYLLKYFAEGISEGALKT